MLGGLGQDVWRRPVVRQIKVVVATGFCLAFHLAALAGQSVSLAWDSSPDTNVTGYVVYSGNASGTYSSRVDVGTNTSTTVASLAEGSTYYFVVTAYNADGIESGPSNEVDFIVPGLIRLVQGGGTNAPVRVNFPVAPGRNYGLQATTDLFSWVTIWQTNCASNCWVEFKDPEAKSRPMRFYRVQFLP